MKRDFVACWKLVRTWLWWLMDKVPAFVLGRVGRAAPAMAPEALRTQRSHRRTYPYTWGIKLISV